MILGGKDFDIDTLLTQLELGKLCVEHMFMVRKEEGRKKQHLRSLQLE
jgi:hypothetical protein